MIKTTTIAIAAHKGGVAKTVTTMGLGAALARQDKRTLLIDLDPQQHCGLGLNVETSNHEPTSRDLFESPTPLEDLIRPTGVSNLDIIPANIRLEGTVYYLHGQRRQEERVEALKQRIEPLRGIYQHILIDTPPALNPLTENAIAAADLVLIPCEMGFRAADGVVDALEVISDIKGKDFAHWRILLTKVDARKSFTNRSVLRVLEPWKDKIFRTSIPASEPLNQAQMARCDIFSFDPNSKGAEAYQALAQEVVNTYG